MEYKDYKYILIVKTEHEQGVELSKELRISLDQVKVLLTEERIKFLNENGWVTSGKTLIEKRKWSINDLEKKFPKLSKTV